MLYHNAVDDSSVELATGGIETVIVLIGVDACNVDVVGVDTFFDELQAVAFPEVDVPPEDLFPRPFFRRG